MEVQSNGFDKKQNSIAVQEALIEWLREFPPLKQTQAIIATVTEGSYLLQQDQDDSEDDENPDLRLRAASMWLKTSGWEGRKKSVQTSEDKVKNILIQANNIQMNG